MIEYMADSYKTNIDPRKLTLDLALQARDVTLIKDKLLRSSQEYRQANQDKELLEDLNNGLPIHTLIKVFIVNDRFLVIDGFHRTKACLEYLRKNPDNDLTIPALVFKNRSYKEAVAAAQDVNQNHGVSVTSDEIMQSKFRKLIIEGKFSLSISEVMKIVGCSRGQAAHICKGLKACGQCFTSPEQLEFTNLQEFISILEDGLSAQMELANNIWDSNGFPKIRKLSDAVSGKGFAGGILDDEAWEASQVNGVKSDLAKLIDIYGDDFFREGFRKHIKGSGLGISITNRNKWLEQAGSVENDNMPEDWDGSSPISAVEDF